MPGTILNVLCTLTFPQQPFEVATISIIQMWKLRLREKLRDFLGGPLVRNPPSNAGNVGVIPGGGTKIPHAAGKLSPCATTTEPACHN